MIRQINRHILQWLRKPEQTSSNIVNQYLIIHINFNEIV